MRLVHAMQHHCLFRVLFVTRARLCIRCAGTSFASPKKLSPCDTFCNMTPGMTLDPAVFVLLFLVPDPADFSACFSRAHEAKNSFRFWESRAPPCRHQCSERRWHRSFADVPRLAFSNVFLAFEHFQTGSCVCHTQLLLFAAYCSSPLFPRRFPRRPPYLQCRPPGAPAVPVSRCRRRNWSRRRRCRCRARRHCRWRPLPSHQVRACISIVCAWFKVLLSR